MKIASIPPKNLLLLAALGIGLYWFTRQASASGQSPSNVTKTLPKAM